MRRYIFDDDIKRIVLEEYAYFSFGMATWSRGICSLVRDFDKSIMATSCIDQIYYSCLSVRCICNLLGCF